MSSDDENMVSLIIDSAKYYIEKAPGMSNPDLIEEAKKRGFIPGAIVKHFKREIKNEGADYLYLIIGISRHTETGEEFMCYKPLYEASTMKGVSFASRPLSMFLSEVDHEKYPDIKQKYRFEVVSGE